MFKLTKFSGEEVWINPDMIKYVEASGDTIVTLLSGERLLVRESVDEIRQLFLEYKVAISQGYTEIASEEQEP